MKESFEVMVAMLLDRLLMKASEFSSMLYSFHMMLQLPNNSTFDSGLSVKSTFHSESCFNSPTTRNEVYSAFVLLLHDDSNDDADDDRDDEVEDVDADLLSSGGSAVKDDEEEERLLLSLSISKGGDSFLSLFLRVLSLFLRVLSLLASSGGVSFLRVLSLFLVLSFLALAKERMRR